MNKARFATRRRTIDWAKWPTVDARQLPRQQRERYRQRELAIRLYLSGTPLKKVAQKTGNTNVIRMLKRCLSTHHDGRLFGFRALVPHARVARYARQLPIRKQSGLAGRAGTFAQLISRHPALEQLVRAELRMRRVLVVGEPPRRRVLGLESLHKRFIRQCRQDGVLPSEYPLSQKEMAIRSLSGYVKTLANETFERAAHLAGAAHIKGPASTDARDFPIRATRPLEMVEFDGHLLDIPLQLTMHDPAGVAHVFKLERIWLLVIIDVFSRAVLAHHLVLERQYNSHDVVRTVEKALIPHRNRTFILPGLAYPEHGGFPNSAFPELAYAAWDWFRFDRAKAHWAHDTLRVLCEFIGCIAHAGPPYKPDERPFVERFFGTLATHFAHRLPGGLDVKLKNLRRRPTDQGVVISLEELEDLVEIMIAEYNGNPHSSLAGRTPLEYLTYFLREKHTPLRWLAEPQRRNLCLLQTPRQATVRGSLSRGIRPYVHFLGVRYTSQLLARLPNLLGQPITLYYHPDDLRTLRAFYPDGTELGNLDAAHPWRFVPHNETLRRDILKLRREGRLHLRNTDDPVAAYIELQQKQANKSRQAANKLAQAQRILTSAVTPEPSGKPEIPDKVDGPVKGRKLPIGSGHAF